MRFVVFILLLLVSAAFEFAPPANRIASTQSTRAATSSRASSHIRRLVEQLGDKSYEKREAAQRELAALGDAALPELVQVIDCDNAEIARRTHLLIRRPKDPALRVELVRRLIATGDPARVQTGIYMLFKSPIEDYPRFKEVTDASTGVERAMFKPVCEQLKQWRQATEIFERRQQEHAEKNELEAAKKEREMQAGSYYYQAEAGYALAIDAYTEYLEAHSGVLPAPTSQPTDASSQPVRK